LIKLKFLNSKNMKTNFFFKGLTRLFLMVISIAFSNALLAQTQPPSIPDTSKMTYNQISSGLKLFVYPAKGQNQNQQKTDEFECYKWSVQQSGVDPLNLPKVEAPPPQTGPTGGAVVGAAKGAAAGAAIGAIAGDAGKGAAIGAVAGGLSGRRQGKQAQAQANQQAQAQATQKEQDMINSFVKGFSACLEGKGYTIK
jgi:Glycine-zipper domain